MGKVGVLVSLTPEQKAAVETGARVALVFATPGSGKTRVIAERIIHLLRKGVPGHKIVALTFTRAAANELQRRVRAACVFDDRAVPIGLTCTTIHGYCRSLMPHRNVLGDFEAKTLFKSVFLRRTYKEWEEQERSGVENPELAAYAREMVESNSWDYCGMLLSAIMIMRGLSIPRIAHVLVDEAQDLSGLQWQIIMNMSAQGSLFAVGDPSQAIYQWRYADPQHFLSLAESPATGAAVYRLTYSFRCPSLVCRAANSLLPEPPSGAKVQAMPEATAGKVSLCSGQVAFMVESIVAEKAHWGDCAVLCRSNRMVDQVVMALQSASVPAVRVGAKRSQWDGPEIQEAIATLKLICRPRCWPSLLVMLKGMETDSFIAECRAARQAGGWAAIEKLVFNRQLVNKSLSKVIRCWRLSDVYAETNANVPFMAESCLLSVNQSWVSQSALAGLTLDKAIERFEGIEPTEELLGAGDAVTVCTVHQAKGCEWSHVWLAGVEAGEWPPNSAYGDGERLAEETRILYVAATRAGKTMTIHYRETPSSLLDGLLTGSDGKSARKKAKKKKKAKRRKRKAVDRGTRKAVTEAPQAPTTENTEVPF